MLKSGVGRERGQILYKFADILEVSLATVQISSRLQSNGGSVMTSVHRHVTHPLLPISGAHILINHLLADQLEAPA